MRGPVVADSTFTIIDLLRHIGLDEQADSYTGKLVKHVKAPVRLPFGWTPLIVLSTTWEHLKSPGKMEPKHLKRLEMEREIWERYVRMMEVAKTYFPERPALRFEPEHKMWPPHRTQVAG